MHRSSITGSGRSLTLGFWHCLQQCVVVRRWPRDSRPEQPHQEMGCLPFCGQAERLARRQRHKDGVGTPARTVLLGLDGSLRLISDWRKGTRCFVTSCTANSELPSHMEASKAPHISGPASSLFVQTDQVGLALVHTETQSSMTMMGSQALFAGSLIGPSSAKNGGNRGGQGEVRLVSLREPLLMAPHQGSERQDPGPKKQTREQKGLNSYLYVWMSSWTECYHVYHQSKYICRCSVRTCCLVSIHVFGEMVSLGFLVSCSTDP